MRVRALAPLTLVCLVFAACHSDPTGTSVPTALSRAGGASDIVSLSCTDCVFGPTTYTRESGPPQVETATFSAVAGEQYTVDIDDLGTAGADGSVVLNGTTLMATRVAGEVGPRHITTQVTLAASNTFTIRLTGKKDSQLQVSVRPVCFPGLPKPILVLQQIRHVIVGGVDRSEYDLDVTNSASFPDALFAASPALPPCGLNTSAARTFVEIFADNVRVFGFCALTNAAGLNTMFFSLEAAAPPPTSAFIQLNDRLCGITYQSDPIALPLP